MSKTPSIENSTVGKSTQEELDLYVEKGIAPNPFLRAVLENDLAKAINTQWTDNLAAVVRYVERELPKLSHGSPERVKGWIEHVMQGRHTPKLFDDAG
jgi:hypothetical protein